ALIEWTWKDTSVTRGREASAASDSATCSGVPTWVSVTAISSSMLAPSASKPGWSAASVRRPGSASSRARDRLSGSTARAVREAGRWRAWGGGRGGARPRARPAGGPPPAGRRGGRAGGGGGRGAAGRGARDGCPGPAAGAGREARRRWAPHQKDHAPQLLPHF